MPPAAEHAADVIVVGAGPAGLDAAAALGRAGIGRVVVLEREIVAGGIPRHAVHQGFGLRDTHRSRSGPSYAQAKLSRAVAAGAEVLTERQVTGWCNDGLEVTGPDGRHRWTAAATLLTTGCRERPRAARMVPGARTSGVMTTGMLQQLVYLSHRKLGGRAVIVGAELVSYSSLLTLAHGGVRPVAMVTELDRHQTAAPLATAAALRYRLPVLTRTSVTAIHGDRSVEGVELTGPDGSQRTVECDFVIFTADWIPDAELAVTGGLVLAAPSMPAVDAALRTSRPTVLAAGNLLQDAEPADVAALSGRHAAATITAHAAGAPWPASQVPIEVSRPLSWVVPNLISGGEPPPRHRFTVRAGSHISRPLFRIEQDDRVLWTGTRRFVGPGRSTSLPWDWAGEVDPDGGRVRISLT